MRKVHHLLRGQSTYRHVYVHQDKHKKWADMSLLEQLNCKCDSLAKSALLRGILADAQLEHEKQRLPLESAAVYCNSSKLSDECGEEIRFQIGLRDAHRFYLEELGWFAATFDAVDWAARDNKCSRRHWTCFKSGYVSNAHPFASQARIWGDGSVPKQHNVPIATRIKKRRHIFYTALTRAGQPFLRRMQNRARLINGSTYRSCVGICSF